MKTVNVVAALIIKDHKVLCCQRGYGDQKGMWEFPGGKIEPGETGEQAIVREIKEELNADIEVDSFLMHVSYTYPTFQLEMDCYLSHLLSELNPDTNIEENSLFVGKNDLKKVDFLPPDIVIAKRLEEIL